jgi:hypothetical protein
VQVRFGPPMRFAADGSRDRKTQYEAASREMMAAIASLKDEVLAEGRSKFMKEEPV